MFYLFCRFFFKKQCEEFGLILEEMTEEDQVVPLHEGKIFAQIRKADWPWKKSLSAVTGQRRLRHNKYLVNSRRLSGFLRYCASSLLWRYSSCTPRKLGYLRRKLAHRAKLCLFKYIPPPRSRWNAIVRCGSVTSGAAAEPINPESFKDARTRQRDAV